MPDERSTETPDAPERSSSSALHRALVKALARFRGADASSLAAETAYFSILAIAPFFLFLIAGIAIISNLTPIALIGDLERTVERMAPGDTGELLLPLVEEAIDRSDSGTLSFGMLSAMVIAMWSGSRAISSLTKGVGRINGGEVHRPLIWNRIVSLGLAVIVGLVTLFSFAVFLFGNAAWRELAEAVGLGASYAAIWRVISWPLVAIVVFVVVSVFYWSAAGGRAGPISLLSPGAIAASILWVLVMFGIRLFILIVSPGSLYGALGSFVVLVVFFYIMALVILYGAALNAETTGRPPVNSQPAD
jgi:membrane protein